MNLTCIMCPMGCQLTATKTKDGYKITGNNCIRGEQFAKEEMTAPKRIITALVHTDRGVTSVKTSKPVDKTKIFDIMNELDKIHLKSAKIGDVVVKNILNTGADIIITKSI